MSEVKTDKISPSSGTATTIGDSGDTFTVPSGATLTVAGALNVTGTTSLADGTVAVAELDIDGATDIGAAVVAADLFVVDDGAGGTNRKTAASRIKTFVEASAMAVTGNVTATGTIEPAGDTSASDNAAIGYTAGEGLILTGQGSTSDVTIKNDADGTVFTVPTGTDDILFADSAKGMWGTGSDLTLYHDGSNSYITNAVGALKIATETSGIALTIGHTTSETTVADNLTVTGTTTLTGTQTFTAASTFSAGATLTEDTLTDQATVTWDASTSPVAKVTLGANRTLASASSGGTGQFISLLVIQDGTGSRTLTWNAAYEFKDDAAPTLTTTADKGDLFVFRYNGSKWLEVGRNTALTLS